MPSTPSLDQVKDLLADGQTEAAADLLLQLAKASAQEHFSSALLLKNRLETLQQNVIEGVISQSDENLEWARISKGVINLVAQIERNEMPKPVEELLPPKPPKKQPAFSKKILWAIPVVMLLALFFVPKIVKRGQTSPEKVKIQAPELKTIRGQLIWFDERPVPNATLSVERFDKKFEARTDSEGFFDLKVNAELIGKQVDFKIQFNNKEKTETIRLIPENLKRYTLQK